MPKSDQGVGVDRYLLIPRVLIFLFREGEVLLIKGAPTKRLWANRYNGVGGHVERGEDALQAARRELLEETGLTADDLKLCGTLLVDASEGIGIGMYIFKGTGATGELQASPEGDLEWARLDRLERYALVEDLPVILPRVAAWNPVDGPMNGRSFYDENDRLVIAFSD